MTFCKRILAQIIPLLALKVRQVVKGVCLLLALLAATSAFGQPEMQPDSIIKYRKAVMVTMGGHSNAMILIARKKVDAPSHLLGHAEALCEASSYLDMMFPKGSGVGDTEALPLIWEEPEVFEEIVKEAKTATARLLEAVKEDDQKAIAVNVKAVADSCKSCHDWYRK